jgi:Enoyl-CoA hydratase/carnithine racemase
MNYETILVERNIPIAKITLNRPKSLNSLSMKLEDELEEAITRIRDDKEVKILIITGSGNNFSAGDDITEFDKWGGAEQVMERLRKYQRIANEIEDLDKITIAVVDGWATGGGLELTMVCDFVIATPEAKFGMPEIDIGITPGWGGISRLIKYIGKRMTKELIFTGRPIDAYEAKRLGLITYVVPKEKIEETVNMLIKTLLSKPMITLKLAKFIINRAEDVDTRTALAFEVLSDTIAWTSNEGREGRESFTEKKDPWTLRRKLRDEWYEYVNRVEDRGKK